MYPNARINATTAALQFGTAAAGALEIWATEK